jgi:hypothetical protein
MGDLEIGFPNVTNGHVACSSEHEINIIGPLREQGRRAAPAHQIYTP